MYTQRTGQRCSYGCPTSHRTTPHVCTRRVHQQAGTGWGGRGCWGPWVGTGRRDRFYWQSGRHGFRERVAEKVSAGEGTAERWGGAGAVGGSLSGLGEVCGVVSGGKAEAGGVSGGETAVEKLAGAVTEGW